MATARDVTAARRSAALMLLMLGLLNGDAPTAVLGGRPAAPHAQLDKDPSWHNTIPCSSNDDCPDCSDCYLGQRYWCVGAAWGAPPCSCVFRNDGFRWAFYDGCSVPRSASASPSRTAAALP